MAEFYFVWDDNTGFDLYGSEEEARKVAQETLDEYTAEAGDGWAEEATNLCWGKLVGRVVETKRMSWEDHLREQGVEVEEGEQHPFDEYIEYELREEPSDG